MNTKKFRRFGEFFTIAAFLALLVPTAFGELILNGVDQAGSALVDAMDDVSISPSGGAWDLSNVLLILPVIGNGTSSAGYLKIQEDGDNGTNVVSLYAPAAISADYSLILPEDAGGILQTEDTTATLTNKTVSAANNAITIYPSRDFTITDPTDADDILLFKSKYAITITDIHCIVDPADTGESISMDIHKCDGTGDNCVTVDAAIICDNDGAEDDGTLSNGTIDAGDWVKMVLGAPTGTVSALTISIYTEETQ